MKEIVYLCAPYSHADSETREQRVEIADKCAAWLIEQGYNVFSPLSHSHRIARWMGNHDSDFWVELDFPFIFICDLMAILTLDGWRRSKGIHLELSECRGKLVKYIKHNNGRFSWED